MAYQAVFKRYEMKYMMTRRQKKAVLEAMLPYMKLDEFGHTTIRNVYFDTDNYILVRRSIEKPVYKEKFRIRSYKQAGAQDQVFIELKKKYDDVVYKRRESLSQLETLEWLVGGTPFPKATQIGNEIDYFFRLYQTLKPKVFLSYEREAFYVHGRPEEICQLGLTDARHASSESLLGSNVHGRPEEICQPELTDARHASSESLLGSNVHGRPGEICQPGLTDARHASSERLLGSNVHGRPEEICQPGLTDGDFRVTFDENILARQEELSLSRDVWGEPLIGEDKVLMEIKTSGGIPLWMTHVLAREKIYKTSFSKYGTAYEKMICGHQTEKTGRVSIA